jgi:hypothetical protein
MRQWAVVVLLLQLGWQRQWSLVLHRPIAAKRSTTTKSWAGGKFFFCCRCLVIFIIKIFLKLGYAQSYLPKQPTRLPSTLSGRVREFLQNQTIRESPQFLQKWPTSYLVGTDPKG